MESVKRYRLSEVWPCWGRRTRGWEEKGVEEARVVGEEGLPLTEMSGVMTQEGRIIFDGNGKSRRRRGRSGLGAGSGGWGLFWFVDSDNIFSRAGVVS